MFDFFVIACMCGLIFTSAAHSVIGEKLLLQPMLKHRGNAVLERPLARLILRFAWHLTSVMWLVLAYIIYVVAFDPANTRAAIFLSVGISMAAIGIFDLFASKGKHIGWPFLTLTGVFGLGAYFFG